MAGKNDIAVASLYRQCNNLHLFSFDKWISNASVHLLAILFNIDNVTEFSSKLSGTN